MGYVTKDIAIITEPLAVTLAGISNFTQFATKPTERVYLSLRLEVKATTSTVATATLLRVTPPMGVPREYKGTPTLNKVDGSTFYLAAEASGTAENLRQALLSDAWFNANFEITLPSVWQGETVRNGAILHVVSKGAGVDYNVNIEAPNDNAGVAYTVTWVERASRNNDSISGEASTAEICLEVYADPAVKLGQDDKPTTPDRMGRRVATLAKTYAGSPIWFDTNAIFSQYGAFNRPPSNAGWFDAGTCQTYRFVAKIKAANSQPFYHSNALYILNGRGEEVDLTPYVYEGGTVKLLTNKPATPYVRGQREYLNFIYSERAGHAILRAVYQAYGTNGAILGAVYGVPLVRFETVNTCILDIDAVLDRYPAAGVVRVALARGEAIVSNDIEYTVRPSCLHTLHQFVFLNRLGGWDTFNFDSTVKADIKPSVETYGKTRTPLYCKGENLETTYSVTLASTFTIEGAPVTDEMAAWLKELATSRAVFDGSGNYIIIEEFNLSVVAANKNMHRPTIKYRLSQ